VIHIFTLILLLALMPFYSAFAQGPSKTLPASKTQLTKKRDLSKIDFSLFPILGSNRLLIEDHSNNSMATITSRIIWGLMGKVALTKNQKKFFIQSEMNKISFAQSSDISISNRDQDLYSIEGGVLWGKSLKYGFQLGRRENLFLAVRDGENIVEKLAQTNMLLVGESDLYRIHQWKLKLNLSGGAILPSKNDYVSSKAGWLVSSRFDFQQLTREGGWLFGLSGDYRKQNSDKVDLQELGLKFFGGYHLFF
jgi:hypothetical protein